MLGRDIQKLDQDFRSFRNRVRKMVKESTEEANRHVRMQKLPIEVPFHEGEAGAYQLVLSILDESSAKNSPISLNAIEEIYIGFLLDYKRMRGSAEALGTVLTEMQNLFELPSEKELEQNERLARRVTEYSAKSPGKK